MTMIGRAIPPTDLSGLRVEIREVVGWLELVEFAHHLTFSS